MGDKNVTGGRSAGAAGPVPRLTSRLRVLCSDRDAQVKIASVHRTGMGSKQVAQTRRTIASLMPLCLGLLPTASTYLRRDRCRDCAEAAMHPFWLARVHSQCRRPCRLQLHPDMPYSCYGSCPLSEEAGDVSVSLTQVDRSRVSQKRKKRDTAQCATKLLHFLLSAV